MTTNIHFKIFLIKIDFIVSFVEIRFSESHPL